MAPQTSKDQAEWNEAAGWAKEGATSIGDAATCAKEAAAHATSAVGATAGKKVDEFAQAAGRRLQDWGDKISEQGSQGGLFGTASQVVGQTVRSGGSCLADHKVTDIVDDLAIVVKRTPLPSVLCALAIGWWVGRRI